MCSSQISTCTTFFFCFCFFLSTNSLSLLRLFCQCAPNFVNPTADFIQCRDVCSHSMRYRSLVKRSHQHQSPANCCFVSHSFRLSHVTSLNTLIPALVLAQANNFFIYEEDKGQDLGHLINRGKFITSIHMQINSLLSGFSGNKEEERAPTKKQNKRHPQL